MSRFSTIMRAAGLPLLALVPFIVGGCSEDSVAPPAETPEIELITILCNPLAPAPGDTAIVTVQLTGEGGEADFAWTVSGGTLLGNGTITVQWVAPDVQGVYEIGVIANIDAAVDTATKYVLVRNFEEISTGIQYCYYPHLIAEELYFVGSDLSPLDDLFFGYLVYRSANAYLVTTNTTPVISGGNEFIFGTDAVFTSVVTSGSEFLRQQAMNVIRFPLITGIKWYVSNNEFAGTIFRKNQHVHPCPSSSMNTAVWQYNKVGIADDGTQDLVNVLFRNGLDPIQPLTTSVDSIYFNGLWEYSYYRNIKPLFSPDMSTIVYFVDSTGTYEPCFIPLVGSAPQLEERRALMVDTGHGIFYYAGVTVTEKTVFQWNPVASNQLFFIDGGGKLCLFDIAAESVEILAEKVQEFVLSDDGAMAVIAEDGVYLGTSVSNAERIFAKERDSDDIFGVSWSSGSSDPRIVFRMVRKGASAAESFSAMVLYSLEDERWYYASPRIPFGSEPDVDDYRWRRVAFEESGDGFIAPISTSADGGGVTLYRSY